MPCGRTPERLEVDAVVEALISAAVATDVLVDPALPLGHQFLGFPRASAGRPFAWIERRGRGGRRGCVPGRGDPPRGRCLRRPGGRCVARSSRAAMMPRTSCAASWLVTRRMTCGLSGCSACSWSPSAIRSYRWAVLASRPRALDSTVLNDEGATQGHDHPARSLLAWASRPLPAPRVRHKRVGRRS